MYRGRVGCLSGQCWMSVRAVLGVCQGSVGCLSGQCWVSVRAELCVSYGRIVSARLLANIWQSEHEI